MAKHYKKKSSFYKTKYLAKQIKREFGIDCKKKYGNPSFADLVKEMENYYSKMDKSTLQSLNIEYQFRIFQDSSTGDSLAKTAMSVTLFGIFASCYLAVTQNDPAEQFSLLCSVTMAVILILFLIMLDMTISLCRNRKKKYFLFKQLCLKRILGNN